MQEFKTAKELMAHYAALKARNRWWGQSPSQDGRLIPLKPVPAEFRHRKEPRRSMVNILSGPVVWETNGTMGQLAREIEEMHGLPYGTLKAKDPRTKKVFRARQEFCYRALHLCKTCSQVARFLNREHSTVLSQADQYRKSHERELAANPGVEDFSVSESSRRGRMGSMQQSKERQGWGEIKGIGDD